MPTKDRRRDVRCALCGASRVLVDEHDRCERCVLDAAKRSGALADWEERAMGVLEAGATVAQLRAALDLFLADDTGLLPGDFIERDAEGWAPPRSVFLDDETEDREPRLRQLRRLSRWTLEEFADVLDVEPSTVALWERGAKIPERALACCSELFGVSTAWITGEVGL
jgi:DNA-binding XRE family transcriptional regulator